MHHSLQIMIILPLMTGHLFRKATVLGDFYRGAPLYHIILYNEMIWNELIQMKIKIKTWTFHAVLYVPVAYSTTQILGYKVALSLIGWVQT